MELVTIQTELTTAATDIILGIIGLISALSLLHFRALDAWKMGIWFWAFFLLTIGSLTGAIVHGVKLDATLYDWLWRIIFLALGLTVSLFVVAAIYDRWGRAISDKSLPLLLIVAAAFFGLTQLIDLGFLIFIMYEGLAMLFALGTYLWLMSRKRSGSALLVVGILLNILAAIAQSLHGIRFTFIWEFDHNGLFHLIQIVAVLFIVAGVRRSINAYKVT